MAAADLTFLYGESVPKCTHRIDKRFVGYNTLQYMSGGAVDLKVDARQWRLEGRWFWSAYPGPRIGFHTARGHRSWSHRYIAFRGNIVKRWTDAGLFPIDPQPAPRGHDYGERFDALLQQVSRADKWSTMRAGHILEGLLIDLAEDRAGGEHCPAWLKKTIERLDRAALGDEIDYDVVAADLGMAQSTLRRRFRQATGMPPHEFVLNARVAQARQLLGETDLPIKSIAQKLGYRDVYFFSRQFRRHAGVPPALYRKSRQD
jgi:AraC-like DNA-binding protein